MSDPRKLGRLLQHDPKSRDYPAQGASQIKTVIHQRHCTAFDQGDTSSCTGNAMAQCLMTDPFWRKGRHLDEVQARILYGMATKLDGLPGEFPPDDTGSSGLGVAKAAKALGYISAYHHAFGLEHALAALTLAPVIVGVEWLEGCDARHGWPGPLHGTEPRRPRDRGIRAGRRAAAGLAPKLVGPELGPPWHLRPEL